MGQQVDQGAGSPNAPDWSVSAAARFQGATTEVPVTNAAGGTPLPATPLTDRKVVLIQNLGPNPIYVTVDGSAPVVGSHGHRIEAATATASVTLKLEVGPRIALRAIAATAAQVSGAATMVTELR